MRSPWPEDLAEAYAAHPGLEARWPLTHVVETSSTNDLLMALAHEGAPLGTAVVADVQTAGRGRRGRTWSSPAGVGLYVSVLLPSYAAGAQAPSPWLTVMAGLAAAGAVRAVASVEACLKWPNDLVVHERPDEPGRWRKLGGVLAEGVTQAGRIPAVVVGIGINLHEGAHPAEVSALSTNLAAEGARLIDRGTLLTALLEQLALGGAVLEAGQEQEFRRRFLAWSPLSRGGRVMWADVEAERHGVAVGVDEGAALLVETAEGLARLVSADLVWERHGTLVP